ncbi:MAG: hypothetical protein QM757_38795 [Paludibaculum sp.]
MALPVRSALRRKSYGCSASALDGDDAETDAGALSAARRRASCLFRLVLQKRSPHIDELHDRLDLESINALNIALQKYEGTSRLTW